MADRPASATGPVHDPAVRRLRDAVAAWQAARPRTQSWRGTVRLVGVVQWPEAIADLSRDDIDALCALLAAATPNAPPDATSHQSGAER